MMKRPLKTVFVTGAILLVIYAAFVQWLPISISTAQNQYDTNLIRVQDYLRAPDRRVVLAGSSLTFRLPQPVLGAEIANVGLAGDGARTVLYLIRDSGARPGLVLVESNLLMHPPSVDLVKSQLRFPDFGLRAALRMLRTGYDPVNLLWRGLAALTHKGDAEPVMPPQIVRQLTDKQRAEKSHPPDRARLHDSLADTAAVVKQLQARGIKVGFFEMPIDPDLMHSPFDDALRREELQEFPESRFCWLRPEVPGGAHTVDGIHLTQADAALVARQLVRLSETCR